MSSPASDGGSEVAHLRTQLRSMQRSFEEANAARDTAFEELRTTKRQVELSEAARQHHDAEARSQAVRAVSEMQKLAERRVTQAELDAERQIQQAERQAEQRVQDIQSQAEERLRAVQQQAEGIADATRKLHDAEARRQALRAVSEVQKMADMRMHQEKARMDEEKARMVEKAELAVRTAQSQVHEVAAARVTEAQAEHSALLDQSREASEQRMEEMRRQFERERSEAEIQTKELIAKSIADAEARAAQARKDVEAKARAEATRAIEDAHAAAAEERSTALRVREEAEAEAQSKIRLSEEAIAAERETREAAESRIRDETEARLRAEEYAAQAAQQVQVAQIRLKAASEGALMARRALVTAQEEATSRAASPSSSTASFATSLPPPELGAAVQAYVAATGGGTSEGAEVEELQLGGWSLRQGADGELIWTGAPPEEDGDSEGVASEHTQRPQSVPDALLWVSGLTTLTDGMHAPLMSWLQQVCGSPPPSDASLAVAAKGTDASFEVLRQRCQFIEHWANTIAQHGPDMEELIKAKNEGNPAFAFLTDTSSVEGKYFQECMMRFRSGTATPGSRSPRSSKQTAEQLEADNVLQLIAEHESALRKLQRDAQSGQLDPAAVTKIEQVTASILNLTSQLDRLEASERDTRVVVQRKRSAKRSTSRPKSRRASSRGRQSMYAHGEISNRHSRQPEPASPRRPTTPGRQGARTPGRQGAKTPNRQGARTPRRQGAVTPGRARSGATTPKRPSSARRSRSTRRGAASPRAKRASGGKRGAMATLEAEAKAYQSKPAERTATAGEAGSDAPAVASPAKRAQSNPRSLFGRKPKPKPANDAAATPDATQRTAAATPPPPTAAEEQDSGAVPSAKSHSAGASSSATHTHSRETKRLLASQREIPRKVQQLRVKLKVLSYSSTGQDPTALFRHYDRDNSGELDMAEFTQAVRKGGMLTKNDITDGELRQLFRAIDEDGGGTISIDEMTEFVWGREEEPDEEV